MILLLTEYRLKLNLAYKFELSCTVTILTYIHVITKVLLICEKNVSNYKTNFFAISFVFFYGSCMNIYNEMIS